MQLKDLVGKLDNEFKIRVYGKDLAFSNFIPQVYKKIGFNWESVFEEEFCKLFNGLMIKGKEKVASVFLAVFPTDDVLEQFINQGNEGDLLFMHHPLLMECGDPKDRWGRGFLPIRSDLINRIKKKGLSVYTCHIPMDYHKDLGTSIAIAKSLNVEIDNGFISNNWGENLVLIGNIKETNKNNLIDKLKDLFNIPYVDFEGKNLNKIKRVAIVAGCGDKVEWMKEAENHGVQAYITGEIHCHIDNDYGRKRYQQMMDFAKVTNMSLIGVSHSASEYLVKKTLMKDWFEQICEIETILIPQKKWWL